MNILISALAIVAGLLALVFASDRFVDAAAALARRFGVSPAVIGLTIVGFGSAAPELLVAAIAALEGSPQLALGNALGSNIANFTIVLGAVVLIAPLSIPIEILKRDLVLLIAFIALMSLLMLDGSLGSVDGALLLGCLFIYLYLSFKRSDSPLALVQGEGPEALESEDTSEPSTLKSALAAILSFAILLGGAHLLVLGASSLARAYGVSELVIGLTIVALGTSLPELAASASAARRGLPGLALGNLIGANIYNILGVLGLPALIGGVEREEGLFTRELPLVIGSITLFAGLAIIAHLRRAKLGRVEGALLIAAYLGMLIFVGN